jgi:hypothetical protein
MADNPAKYGFRLARFRSGYSMSSCEEAFCISGATFAGGAATAAALRPGDPIVRLNSGAVNVAPGTDGTPGDVLGIVIGIKQYLDPSFSNAVTARGNALPSSIAYGSNLELQSKVLYIPAEAAVWRITVNDATTATTLAAYQAFIGENCSHIHTALSGETKLAPKLNISTHAATATLDWRIVGIPDVSMQDFTGLNVDLEVTCNRPQSFTGAGTMWLGI